MNSLAAALMFFSLASPVYEAGSIQGSVSVFEAGYKLDCVRVWLIPRSPEIDAAIDLKFGALDEGLHEMPATSRPDARSEPPVGTRESRCLGRFTERFGFSEVPPGEYYLTLTAAPRVRYESENKLSPTTIEMMQRVTVAPGSSVTSDFRLIG